MVTKIRMMIGAGVLALVLMLGTLAAAPVGFHGFSASVAAQEETTSEDDDDGFDDWGLLGLLGLLGLAGLRKRPEHTDDSRRTGTVRQ